ncbi:MAG TPA: VOC family protein [Oligoflexus sp.]|uniref:VOC family protein n=1 Tax=Oligoflexus sp. TaxID=1971216 RepID=UPI002D7F65BD|nr:VOC family protein [Oligoflexus sp.]HET9241021.1 VOC family protein [Oligoflexus sp.]
MIQVHPYLFFNGNCREAMTFYHKHIGGDLQVMTYADIPGGEFPPGLGHYVMHGALTQGSLMIMASDSMGQGQPIVFGSSVQLTLSVDTVADAERLFKALGDGGSVDMPLEETFWAKRFGSVTDRFGIKWMINFEGK